MAWSTPLTAVSNAALTAAQWNASVRDNLLETAAGKATTANRIFVTTGANAIAERAVVNNFVGTAETTASTTYTDLTTAGPASTTTSGTQAIVAVTTDAWNNTLSAYSYNSLAVSGATTLATSDSRSVSVRSATADASAGNRASFVDLLTGLTAGSNTFTSKYRVSAGTGRYSNRSIMVIPL
jgi:hypothetical protein